MGGRSDAALERAAKHSEGWIGVWCSSKRYSEALDILEEKAEGFGRSQVDWCHGYQPWIGIDRKDSKKARMAVEKGMESFYKIPFSKFERYTPFGKPSDVAEQLAAYAEAGCRLFNLKVCTSKPEEEMELGAEVLALLRKI